MPIAQNIADVKSRIAAVCRRINRDPNSVKLIAVTKTVGVEAIKEAIAAGVTVLGENRVQEAWTKFQAVGPAAEWHLIGHLQTNKVKRVLQFASMIQSVDSLRLARHIQEEAAKLNKNIDILVQVNTSAESSKSGFLPEETMDSVSEIAAMPNLNVHGLMTLAVFSDDTELVRRCFVRLRDLRDGIHDKGPPGGSLRELSMGMTNDFEVAIEEGATMVRIGRSIFGERVN